MHHPNARRLLYMYRLHIYICIHSTSINTRQSRKQKCRKVCDHIKSKWQWFSAGGWVVLQGKDPSCSGYRQLVEMQDQEAQTVRARKAVLGCSWHLWSAGEGSRRHLLIFNGGGGGAWMTKLAPSTWFHIGLESQTMWEKKKVTCYFASLTAVTLTATPPPSTQNPPNVNVLHHVSLALLLKYT